jgi:hypothetical protein
MQLKGLICHDTRNEDNGANSSAARSTTSSLDSTSDLSQVPSVSPLKSKPAWALSLQGWMRRIRAVPTVH